MAQFTIALDSAGNKINIKDAPEREKYTCINCKCQMMAKKGDIREWHFSQYNDNQKCNHDGWLHKELLNILTKRLDSSEPMIVVSPEEEISLGSHIDYKRERKFENYIPDILIKRQEDVLFIEVCVTNHCSKEKINSGNKIIEICTCQDEAIEELSSGPISCDAKYYELNFYNFNPIEKEEIPKTIPTDIPDIISDESNNECKISIQEQQSYTNVFDPNVIKGKHTYYFVVHSDRSYELNDFLKVTTNDLLVLGINTFKDFALNIGKSYAWRKGLLDYSALTEYETHIDMSAVIKAFDIIEYHIE